MNIENANMISQQNTTMNLRKVCNHPFLFGEPKVSKKDYIKGSKLHTQFTDKVNTVTTNSPIKNNKRATKSQVYVDLDSDCEDLFRSDTPPITSKSSALSRVESTISLSNGTDNMDYIGVVDPQTVINGSGKVKLLDRMLPLLKKGNHKVLIFSQMTELLNIIQDYCYYKKYNMVRLDGSTKLIERQAAIDSYNNPNDDVFIFLLSTRAGGLGINLTAADTVFIFDSDWNPHQDSQAQDRCHRIGQKKPVIVYRLLTHNSIEIEMMERQLSKKKLEKLTIHGGDYRKAGERWGKEMTISTLRRLLSDEVNVSRMSTHNSSNNLEDGVDIDISDTELASIMNRQLLFPSDDNCSIALEGDCYDIVDNKGESSILQALN
jgi:ATP-dependent DNA helicase